MKVVYLKNQGGNKRGDVKDVAEGFARNFLLPQGTAAAATPELLLQLKKEQEQKRSVVSKVVSANSILAGKLSGRQVEIVVKANEAGHLYAAVSEAQIKTALANLGFKIDSAKIVLSEPIKAVGKFKASVDFGQGITANINISVSL